MTEDRYLRIASLASDYLKKSNVRLDPYVFRVLPNAIRYAEKEVDGVKDRRCQKCYSDVKVRRVGAQVCEKHGEQLEAWLGNKVKKLGDAPPKEQTKLED